MTLPTKPEMAYPTFAAPTASFSPSRWPVIAEADMIHRRFEADARTASGGFIRHTSPVTERRVTLTYAALTTAELDSFAAPNGSGFFYTTGGEAFEYRHHDGAVHQARFASAEIETRPAGAGRWELGPIELILS